MTCYHRSLEVDKGYYRLLQVTTLVLFKKPFTWDAPLRNTLFYHPHQTYVTKILQNSNQSCCKHIMNILLYMKISRWVWCELPLQTAGRCGALVHCSVTGRASGLPSSALCLLQTRDLSSQTSRQLLDVVFSVIVPLCSGGWWPAGSVLEGSSLPLSRSQQHTGIK